MQRGVLRRAERRRGVFVVVLRGLRRKAGDDRLRGEFQLPLREVCNANGTCVPPGGAGATCDDSDPEAAVQPCLPSFYCLFPAAAADGGTATGTCTALGTSGQACNPNDDWNDCADSLFCNTQGTCAAIQYVAIGGACDDVGLLCTDANCLFPTAQDASVATGVCTAYAADGASCQSDEDCLFNAACVNGTCSTATVTCN